ncbi:unnamed protein product [Meloidogyne enterolobii]|uniref:Uncharacterized protein n=1 Tax=Meloidogyne enterolobii TaxID=390850 RepID=A0ACB1A8Y5_MELEN
MQSRIIKILQQIETIEKRTESCIKMCKDDVYNKNVREIRLDFVIIYPSTFLTEIYIFV